MLSSMVSGIVMSRYVFDFLPIQGGWGWARTLHMLAAYWGFLYGSGIIWPEGFAPWERRFEKHAFVD